MTKTGCIYKITNTKREKSYIGKTVNFPKRIQFHIDHAETYASKQPMYHDMAHDGIECFTFQILESNIPIENLDQKEIDYIALYDAVKTGYNVQRGGKTRHTQKITEMQANEIKRWLKTNASMTWLASEYGVDRSTISDINCGDTWFDKNESYPIRSTNVTKKNFSENTIQEIYNCLRNLSSLSKIAKKYGTSVQTISKINKGAIYYHASEKYPICEKQMCSTRIDTTTLSTIINLLTTTSDSYVVIARKTNTDRHTIAKINTGERYQRHVTSLGYTFPLRKKSGKA